jgi:hypothetical protein
MKSQEEKKQELIIRQSQVNAVIEYFKLIDKKPNLSDVVKLSTMMEQYIHNGYTKELGVSFLKIDEHVNSLK